uniref:Uncharacterized protein n=1 Tax=Rhinolophus ferrumequinum TaxID=59479 RepID=A0A671EUQ6_RHIFE
CSSAAPRRCAAGGAGAWRRWGTPGRATPCGGCAGSPEERRSHRRCARGAGAATRGRPASAGPSPCAPRRRQLLRATGRARLRTAAAQRRPGAGIQARRALAAAAGCRTQGCDPG